MGLAVIILYACRTKEPSFDATGVFEATEIIVSSEATGKIIKFSEEEGAVLQQGQPVAWIDVLDLELQKAQIEASMEALEQKQNEPGPQILVLQEQLHYADAQKATLQTQLDVLNVERTRISNLLEDKAATQKQLDDIDGKIRILEKQIAAANSQKEVIKAQIEAARQTVAMQNRGITSEKMPMAKQLELINNQINKAQVINPVSGTLLSKYAMEGEFTTVGKPLYKVADLSQMILRAYITGDQLGQIKLGQQLSVYIDKNKKEYKKTTGSIIWISDKAEFTPKTVQTKNERTNLVYAIEIAVANDGYLKIGMYGEVRFDTE